MREAFPLTGLVLAVVILAAAGNLVLGLANAGARPTDKSLWQRWMEGTDRPPLQLRRE